MAENSFFLNSVPFLWVGLSGYCVIGYYSGNSANLAAFYISFFTLLQSIGSCLTWILFELQLAEPTAIIVAYALDLLIIVTGVICSFIGFRVIARDLTPPIALKLEPPVYVFDASSHLRQPIERQTAVVNVIDSSKTTKTIRADRSGAIVPIVLSSTAAPKREDTKTMAYTNSGFAMGTLTSVEDNFGLLRRQLATSNMLSKSEGGSPKHFDQTNLQRQTIFMPHGLPITDKNENNSGLLISYSPAHSQPVDDDKVVEDCRFSYSYSSRAPY